MRMSHHNGEGSSLRLMIERVMLYLDDVADYSKGTAVRLP